MSDLRLSQRLISELQGKSPLVVLTGAGISAESGLATFRGPGGLWEGRDPFTLATPEAFAADPVAVWRFYAWRRAQAAAAIPGEGHRAVLALERTREDFLLVTQNVDGLHERCGNRRMVRLHGTLWRLRCCAEESEIEDLRDDLGALPPRCACGGLLRPGVVWFGEPVPARAFDEAARFARRARLVLVIGTSSAVYPAAALPSLAREAGAWIVEVNPEPTPLSELADEHLRGNAGAVLPALAEVARACEPGP